MVDLYIFQFKDISTYHKSVDSFLFISIGSRKDKPGKESCRQFVFLHEGFFTNQLFFMSQKLDAD